MRKLCCLILSASILAVCVCGCTKKPAASIVKSQRRFAKYMEPQDKHESGVVDLLRYRDFDYREEQDDYLEFIAQTLAEGKSLPRNIIADYEPYYHGVSRRWENGTKGFWKEFLRFINL